MLVIDDDLLRRDPQRRKTPGQINGCMDTPHMQKRLGGVGLHDHRQKRLGIAPGRAGHHPRRLGLSRRVIAHTKRLPPRQIGLGRKAGDPVLRGEEEGPDLREVAPDRTGTDLEHRGDQHRDIPADLAPAGGGKSLRGRTGPGQKQRRIAHLRASPPQLSGRSPSVTPRRTAPATGTAMALTILGIESSCDETAAAVVRATGGGGEILSSVVAGQAELHAGFGGVVPEIAARAHAEKVDLCVEEALDRAGVRLADLDAVAVTAGPGLIGGVLSGVMCAKGIAAGADLPLIGVNHLAGHALTPRLTDGVSYPYLMLLVSGGHCQFVTVRGPEGFTRLGGTIDDAPGEAFDKVARLLGLPQPGGPAVEAAAQTGDTSRFALPRPLLDRPGCDLSFSGLKTAVLRVRDGIVAEKGGLTEQDRADICASFQAAVAEVLAEKSARALSVFLAETPASPSFAVAGGVAANQAIRAGLETVSAQHWVRFVAPPLALCTDNAAMIAWAGIELYRAGRQDGFDLVARPRWPLDDSQPALLGGGKKGAKA